MDEEVKTETAVGDPADKHSVPQLAAHKKKYTLLIGAGAIVVLVAALGVFLLNKDKGSSTSKNASAANQSAARESKSGPVFCVKVGLDSLQCEELDTKELRKYELSTTFGEISNISSASPDGSKYLVTGLQKAGTSESAEVISIFDSKHKHIATIPNPDNKLQSYRVEWLDNNRLVYLTDYGMDGQSTIKVFDINSAKEAVLIKLTADIERIMPSGDQRYVHGIQAQTDIASNSVVRKLVVIDLQTKQIVDIENGALDTAEDSLAYDSATKRFYLNVLRQAEQKFNVDIYKVDDLDTKPRFVQAGQVKDVYAQGPFAYKVLSTKKGIFATADMLVWKAPLRLYADDGKSTELSLAVGHYGSSIVLSLPSFPDFVQAKTNTIVTSDLFKPAKGTPEKITMFVEGLIEKAEGCGKGEYASYVVNAYDQDRQFSLSKAGCGDSIGAFYYKLDGNSYVQVARSGTHGFGCEQRDKLGISAVVMPNCRKSGEGL